jgi:tetratricopeptide (TPR) repeat protein
MFGLKNKKRPDIRALLEEYVRLHKEYRLSDATEVLQRALERARGDPSLEFVWLGTILNLLGQLQQEMGEYSKARESFQEALKAQFLPAPDMKVELRQNLAAVDLFEERYQEAYDEFLAVLHLYEAADPICPQAVVRTLNNLSQATAGLGRLAESESYILRAYDTLRSAASPDEPLFAAVLHNLAVSQLRAERLGAALHFFVKARAAIAKHHGEQSIEYGACLHEMACLYDRMLRRDDAVEFAEQAAVLRQSILGINHEAVGESLRILGLLEREKGDIQSAHTHLICAYQIFRDCLGQWHGRTFECLLDAISAAWKAGNWQDSEHDLRNFIATLKGMVNDAGVLLVNRNHLPPVQFSTIAHELGHLFLGHLGPDKHLTIPTRVSMNVGQMELEAESVAYVVCYRHGVKPNSDKYLSNYVKASTTADIIDTYQVMRAAGQVETVLELAVRSKLG